MRSVDSRLVDPPRQVRHAAFEELVLAERLAPLGRVGDGAVALLGGLRRLRDGLLDERARRRRRRAGVPFAQLALRVAPRLALVAQQRLGPREAAVHALELRVEDADDLVLAARISGIHRGHCRAICLAERRSVASQSEKAQAAAAEAPAASARRLDSLVAHRHRVERGAQGGWGEGDSAFRSISPESGGGKERRGEGNRHEALTCN